MVNGGINCFGCDWDYTEGYWLEIEGEEPIFYCRECAERANLIGKPGVYEHTEKEEEEEEVTWTEIMNRAWHLALNSGTFTDDPEEKAGDVYLVKDIRLVVEAFAKDIEEGKLSSYSEPAEFLNKHGIEWE
jgi:hypothetical protein